MGLISKVEDKLSSSKSNSNSNSDPNANTSTNTNTSSSQSNNATQSYNNGMSGGGSSIQNPISSSGGKPTGTAVDSMSGAGATSGMTSSSQGGTYGSQPSGTYSSPSSGTYSSGGTTDRMPESYATGEDPRTAPTSTTTAVPREPYDPYSSKGQQTAADAANRYPSNPIPPTSSTQTTYARSSGEDPNISRSTGGGVLNQTEPQRYSSGGYSDPNASTSQPYRDVGIVGGAGAGGAGATQTPIAQNFSRSGGPSDIRRAADDPTMGGGTGPISSSSPTAVPGESAGLTQAKKMGGAYEAGYRDGMEHMKAEMQGQMQR